MSAADSSVPPPSFAVAPELPPGIERRPPPERPRWKPWTAWVALVAAFGGALVGALLVGVVGAVAGADVSHPTPAMNIASTIVQDVCFVAVAVVFASLAGKPLPEQFGLRRTRFWPAVGAMVVAFFAFYLVTVIWVAIVGGSPDDSKLTDELGVDRSTAALLGAAFLVSVVAPMAEEFFFRGFFFAALRNWRGVWPAAIITGLVFGGIHIGSADAELLLPLAFFGFVLCVLRERTGSLLPCIVLHCANNSLAFGVSQDWGWQIPVLFVSALAIITLTALVVRARWTPAAAPAG
jgi:membrane protease YdiL (CAAX protease family)